MSVTELLKDVEKPPKGSIVIVPFATQPLMEWLGMDNICLGYSTDPYSSTIFKKDCLLSPPRLSGAYVLCFPPWDRKNDAVDKSIFDRYGTDNLYKCFLKNLIGDNQALGGTIIVPLNFFTCARDSVKKCRAEFLNIYKINKLHIYNEITINNYKPIVITFLRRAEPKPTIEILVPVFYPSMTQLQWLFETKAPMLPGADPFKNTPYEKKPTQQIKVTIDKSYDSQTLYVSKYETKTCKICLSNTNNNADYFVSVRGYMSKRLQTRLVQDFNKWVRDWITLTNGVFLNFMQIEGNKVSYILKELVLDAIERIIWSYYSPTTKGESVVPALDQISTP